MPEFKIRYELIERTTQEVTVEAETLDEAKALVEEGNFDNSHSWQVDSLEHSIENVRGHDEPIYQFEDVSG